MSPNSYLTIPSPEKFRRRTTPLPEGHDRYVSLGGFVDIQELTKQYEATKTNKRKQQYGLFGSVSPRSRSSRASSISEDVDSRDWDSVPTTPCRDESCLTPQTPKILFAGSKQTNRFRDHYQTDATFTPTPVPKHNRYGHDLYLNLSSNPVQSSEKRLLIEAHSSQRMPVELAGSLLLPSQGFPQTNPPERPPHTHERSHSAPSQSTLPRSLSIITENTCSPTTPNTSTAGCSTASPMSPFGDPEIMRQPHQRNASHSIPKLQQHNQGTLPVRKSSLRSKMAPPQYGPPPVPLSRMDLEGLMQILPTLDAAIIAHDWIPCMQRRHQELKDFLQKQPYTPVAGPSFEFLNEELGKVFQQSDDMANTYYKLFEVAKDLQDEAMQMKVADADAATAQTSDAKIALARYISQHQETRESYERDMRQVKDNMARSLRILGAFIHQHLGEAMVHAPQQQTQPITEMLEFSRQLRDISMKNVSSDLYHDTVNALNQANEERHGFQELCSEQKATIEELSRDLDQYLARIAKVTRMMQEKEYENRKLKAQNAELELMAEAHKNAARVDQQSKLDFEHFQRAASGDQSVSGSFENEIRARDFEITNLRRKLDKSVVREKELQTQVRSLLQSPQHDDAPHRPSRLKRLLTGGPRGNTTLQGLPMTTSMLNLSSNIFTPFEKERSHIVVPPSPPRSGRTSPSLAGLCGPMVPDHLELPPPHSNYGQAQSPTQFGPRLRQGVRYPLDRDVDSAVSGRFHHMPSNVRSTATNSRPQTPSKNSDASYDSMSEYGRPRFNSAPETPDFRTEPFQQAHFEPAGQPLLNHQRVLSGITEVTEDTGSVKRRSSSPVSEDRRMYLENMQALGQLQIQY